MIDQPLVLLFTIIITDKADPLAVHKLRSTKEYVSIVPKPSEESKSSDLVFSTPKGTSLASSTSSSGASTPTKGLTNLFQDSCRTSYC